MIDYLIFDGNYILHRCVHALNPQNKLYAGLYELLWQSIKKFEGQNKWDKIIFVSDTRKPSWRTRKQKDYKGTRERDETIDWDFVYETYEDFKKELSETYPVFQYNHIEGDDWMYFLTLYANKQNKGVCLITSDRDMNQIIKYNLDGEYMNIQIADQANVHKIKTYIPEGWELLYNQINNRDASDALFDMNDDVFNLRFFDYCRNNFNIVEINRDRFIFEKILTGDKGDNVPSVHQLLTKTGKVYGIGAKTAEKVWAQYSSYNDSFSTNSTTDINEMLNSYEVIKKKSFDDDLKNEIYNNTKSNIEMMELKISSFPDDIKNTIMEKIVTTFNN